MSAVAQIAVSRSERERLLNRENALSDVIALTVADRGLSQDAELQLWRDLRVQTERLLALADDAVDATLEYEANDRRLDNHVATHRGCRLAADCADRRELQRRLATLQRRADRAVRALLGGLR